MLEHALYFIVGGTIVTAAVALAKAGHPFLSGIALIFPSVTLVSFYFIGQTEGAIAVSATAKSALLTMLFIWTPYILMVIYLAPKAGVNRALLLGLCVFLILGSVWMYVNRVNGF